MIRSFGDKTTEDIYHGRASKAALKVNRALWKRIQLKLDSIEAVMNLGDLRVPPSNNLEVLRGDLAGFHSIRVNEQYRIIFQYHDGQCDKVKLADYH
jgi:proteic killer suppression protein